MESAMPDDVSSEEVSPPAPLVLEPDEVPPEPDEAPVPASEVQPKLGLREYVSLAALSQVQSLMMQTWMSQHGQDHWGHYDKAEWDAFVAQARAYVPRQA
jgi:hypothetical protein